MPTRRPAPKPCLTYHRDGSLWAKGQTVAAALHGYWEWYRKDGTRMRSGYFTDGEQTGEWTTYDQHGAVYKVTLMKAKNKAAETKNATRKKSAHAR